MEFVSDGLNKIGEKFVDTCNKIGSQTFIKVVNYTHFHVLLTLEVAGVVYQRHVLPPNESREDDLYGARVRSKDGKEYRNLSTNFAVVKIPCGFAWYSLRASVAHPSTTSEDYVAMGSSRLLHFVYGGSTVSVLFDVESDAKIKLVNESSEENERASENFERLLRTTSEKATDVYENKLAPSLSRMKESVRESVRNLVGSTDQQEYGSNVARDNMPTSQHQQQDELPLHEWQFTEDESLYRNASETLKPTRQSNISSEYDV